MKIYRLAQALIGPVYHGTPYKFDFSEIRGDVKFFAETYNFASDYARQKSQEGQMDADIKVFSAYLQGNIFDPQSPRHIEAIIPYLPEKITVYNDFGMSADLSLEKWKSFIERA